MSEYWFSNEWFELTARKSWDRLIPQIRPTKVLEVGSYEGASACYLINSIAQHSALEIHCIDSWEGGAEHQPDGAAASDMKAVEGRFTYNVQLAIDAVPNPVELVVHKESSDMALARLLAAGKRNYFDFVYIDGSHQAPDVLADAVLAFRLLRVGGLLAFDDYLWAEKLPYGKDPLRCPKPAIDAFVNLNFRRLNVVPASPQQVYVTKVADD
ncbi:MAG: class I SAM-dependent methyltransferase [Burkholderiales bacterium]|nr:class I SAM-dependent methyltransferase [Burkholderiales bacterium]